MDRRCAPPQKLFLRPIQVISQRHGRPPGQRASSRTPSRGAPANVSDPPRCTAASVPPRGKRGLWLRPAAA
eukprot:3346482-Pyramimonas_sp.AAC.1